MEYEQLKLSNQLCFPIYAASRLIIREYQPHLDRLGITYTQYLVLMVLWECDGVAVSEITQKLILNTNTVTPLLKRMESMGLIKRERTDTDERKVMVSLSEKGRALREQASSIPLELGQNLSKGDLSTEQLLELKESLNGIIHFLQSKKLSNST